MREQRAYPLIVDYIVRSLGITVLMILVSFVAALFHVMDMAPALAVLGGMSLIYGMGQIGTSALRDTGISAVNDMRGQAGANPLANYANRQEYKLTRLRQEHPDEGGDREQDAGAMDKPKHDIPSKGADARDAASMTIAGVLALGLSWLAGPIFPH